MTQHIDTTLGELIAVFYEEFLAAYGDEDLAAVATAASINEMLAQDPADIREQAA
jgi:hypothetical protein